MMTLQKIHIGEEIKKVFDDSGMKVQSFAEKIFYSRQNVNGIFKRESLDTDLLIKISNALNFDFFKFYRKEDSYSIVEDRQEIYRPQKKGNGFSVSVTINVDDYSKAQQILELIGFKQ